MTGNIGLEKDIAIGVLSVSGLLLTLVLGLISRSIPEGAKSEVFLGTLALFISAMFGSFSLILIMYSSKRPTRAVSAGVAQDLVWYFLITEILALLTGLMFISGAELRLVTL